jgi:hypothetical protein
MWSSTRFRYPGRGAERLSALAPSSPRTTSVTFILSTPVARRAATRRPHPSNQPLPAHRGACMCFAEDVKLAKRRRLGESGAGHKGIAFVASGACRVMPHAGDDGEQDRPTAAALATVNSRAPSSPLRSRALIPSDLAANLRAGQDPGKPRARRSAGRGQPGASIRR